MQCALNSKSRLLTGVYGISSIYLFQCVGEGFVSERIEFFHTKIANLRIKLMATICIFNDVTTVMKGEACENSPVYTRPLTRIRTRIKLIRVRVNALIRIAIRVT